MRRRFDVVCITVFVLGGSGVALAQFPENRELAARSAVTPNALVRETAIAVGEDRVLTVFHVDSGPSVKIGYAFSVRSGTTWAWSGEGLISPTGYYSFADPTAAHNPNTGDFIIAALARNESDANRIVVSRWDALSESFTAWEALTDGTEATDKPWVVLGNPYEVPSWPFLQGSMMQSAFAQYGHGEFYIVWTDVPAEQPRGLGYRRSTDDGYTWIGGDVLSNLNDPNSRVLSLYGWPLPRVFGDRPLYVAHISNDSQRCSRLVKIEQGIDRTDWEHFGEVQFTTLRNETNEFPLAIELNAGALFMQERLPGFNLFANGSGAGPGAGVDFAVDPSNENKLYLVYHDTTGTCIGGPTPSDPDVNIYIRALTRVEGVRWSVGPQILVADDEIVQETDQFMPQIVVDDRGHLHVIFYSDVNFPTQTDGSLPTKFDVWYAYSDDGGDNWLLQELCEYAGEPIPCVGPDPDPAIDSSLPFIENDFLRDYIGIAVGPDQVWTSFMGITNDDTTTSDKSVIFSTRISRN